MTEDHKQKAFKNMYGDTPNLMGEAVKKLNEAAQKNLEDTLAKVYRDRNKILEHFITGYLARFISNEELARNDFWHRIKLCERPALGGYNEYWIEIDENLPKPKSPKDYLLVESSQVELMASMVEVLESTTVLMKTIVAKFKGKKNEK